MRSLYRVEVSAFLGFIPPHVHCTLSEQWHMPSAAPLTGSFSNAMISIVHKMPGRKVTYNERKI